MTNPGYTEANLDVVSDNPALTGEQMRDMVPFTQAFPDLVAKLRIRGPQKSAR